MTLCHLFAIVLLRDKKARRSKGKGKKEEEPSKAASQNSPNSNGQNGDDVIVELPPPVREEVSLYFHGRCSHTISSFKWLGRGA